MRKINFILKNMMQSTEKRTKKDFLKINLSTITKIKRNIKNGIKITIKLIKKD